MANWGRIINELQRIERKYDPENDVIPGAPKVTHTEEWILETLETLIIAVDNLEKKLSRGDTP